MMHSSGTTFICHGRRGRHGWNPLKLEFTRVTRRCCAPRTLFFPPKASETTSTRIGEARLPAGLKVGVDPAAPFQRQGSKSEFCGRDGRGVCRGVGHRYTASLDVPTSTSKFDRRLVSPGGRGSRSCCTSCMQFWREVETTAPPEAPTRPLTGAL